MHRNCETKWDPRTQRTQTLDLHFSQRGDCKYTSAMARKSIRAMHIQDRSTHGLVGQAGGLGLLLAQAVLRMRG